MFIGILLSSNVVIPIIISIIVTVVFCSIIASIITLRNHLSRKKHKSEGLKEKVIQPLSEQQNDSNIAQQIPLTQQAEFSQPELKKNHGFLTFLGVIFLIILIAGGFIFIAKCAIDKASDGEFNTDGNPVLFNRAATLNDFTLTESVEATITNLKESYILVPNVDIKNLEITFKYYDSSKSLITTKTKIIGNVTKSSEYIVSIEHSLSEIFKISSVSCYVTGGTVSYFA